MSYADEGALKLFELVKKSDLEGLVVKKRWQIHVAHTRVQRVKSHLNPENRAAGIFSKAVNFASSKTGFVCPIFFVVIIHVILCVFLLVIVCLVVLVFLISVTKILGGFGFFGIISRTG